MPEFIKNLCRQKFMIYKVAYETVLIKERY
jgi:hypothetical protein